ncbi:MAG: hypothetical protein AAF702_06005 [Chloroflexota bacterium]
MPDLDLPSIQLPTITLPNLPDGWVYFASWQDGVFSVVVLMLILLLIIWWRQQSLRWFSVAVASLLMGLLLCIGSFYLFLVEPYQVGCPEICTGWRGFPRAVALVLPNQMTYIGPLDFISNLLLIWLIVLTFTVVWRILTLTVDWPQRSLRVKVLCFVALWILPWAMSPRFLNPPQPTIAGEHLRVANNALRAAEFTYKITGFWIQRLAIEDIREAPDIGVPIIIAGEDAVAKQVCLRGYIYFYIPWSRYRIVLEPTSVSSIEMQVLSLSESCWG